MIANAVTMLYLDIQVGSSVCVCRIIYKYESPLNLNLYTNMGVYISFHNVCEANLNSNRIIVNYIRAGIRSLFNTNVTNPQISCVKFEVNFFKIITTFMYMLHICDYYINCYSFISSGVETGISSWISEHFSSNSAASMLCNCNKCKYLYMFPKLDSSPQGLYTVPH